MRRIALMLVCLATAAGAEDGTELKDVYGEQFDDGGKIVGIVTLSEVIRTALEGRTLQYENATQEFRASGRTLYTYGGQDSWGYWRVEGDQYCSQWPPSDLWACYSIAISGETIRFIGEGDDVTVGIYVD